MEVALSASPALRSVLAAALVLYAFTPVVTEGATRARRSATPEGPRLDRRLAREATQELDSEFELVPDDDLNDPRYEPRPQPDRTWIRQARPFGATNHGPNVRISTSVAPPSIGESEVSVAAIGDKLVAGWNDGLVFGSQPGFVGFGYSMNGGATWQDGGSLPVAGATDVYYGDPVLVADPADHWYFADLYRSTPGVTGISVNHGTFAGSAPVWDLPKIIAESPFDLLDKPWLGVDPMDGTVYIAYVRFFANGQHIEFARSLDHGASWSTPVVLTNALTSAVMSPRLVVGPDHELYLLYYSSHNDNLEYLELRSSANHGQTWGPPRIVAGRPYANNFYSGPAGFNRERVVALVSADVDRTAGPTRGRLHVVWHEMQDVYGDILGGSGAIAEVEPNDVAASATPFTPGGELNGSLATATEQDWWSFTGTAGQTFIAQLVPNASSCDGFLRMFAGGGATVNRCALSHFGGGVSVIIFTLPSSGTYFLRVLNFNGNPSTTGAYRVYTGLHTPVPTDVARDHRDILYSSSSDGGVQWTVPRVLSDAPPRYDETFPEVAVDAGGRVYVMWYDHREDAANGILTTMRVRESVDGGVHWLPSVRMDDGPPVNWNLVASNMFPNMGDYSQLLADGGSVHAIWADGRDGTPDPYYARLVNPAVDVPPAGALTALAVRGLGSGPGGSVRALVSLKGSEPARIELFDVLGRRLAVQPLESARAQEVILGSDLPSGIYLVRATQGNARAGARVVAMR